MAYFDIFPTTIYVDKIQNISNEYINYLSQEAHTTDQGGNFTFNQRLLDNEIFYSLKESILFHTRLYLLKLNHIFEDLQIASSWGTSCKPNIESRTHNHANSYISGVYYLTEGSNINFYNPTQSSWSFNPDTTENFKDYFYITPQPNLLVLFPSFLNHQITLHESPQIRRSIAFNIIPKGEFGYETAKLYL